MSVVTKSMPTAVSQINARVDVRRAFEAHYSFVYRLVYRVTGSRAEAEDVTQEAFLRLHDRQLSLERASDARAWLCRVAINIAYNANRGQRRRVLREQRAVHDATLRPDAPAGPAAAVERDEDVAAVRSSLGKLPERTQQLLLLRYAGLSYREVAQVLGVAPTSVGTMLARAEEAFETVYRSQHLISPPEDDDGSNHG